MNHSYPVFTLEAECQDCYKCVRHCPVKAIRVRDGHAAVIPEMCIACGRCVEVCPVKAKQVRNDTAFVRQMLGEEKPVYVSLAPSWISEFPEMQPSQMIRALKKLGFAGVSETALGAQLVSFSLAEELNAGKGDLLLSSACPAAVDYVCKYLPHLAEKITKVSSPLLSHCRLLRDRFGEEIRIVFAGPCIAKKNEADRHPELLNAALTYPELRQMFREAGISPEQFSADPGESFLPEAAEEGARYPIEGGMNDTIQFQLTNRRIQFATLAGCRSFKLALSGLEGVTPGNVVFVEMLACSGGCVHGPCAEHKSPGLHERLRVLCRTTFPDHPRDRETAGSIREQYSAGAIVNAQPSSPELTEALRSIGKTTPEDELNCDGCGYDTCRNFAQAMLAGRAEPSMCVSYLKKQAQKKANALLRSISSGVVICDRKLQIIECNRNFARLFGEDTEIAFEASPGLAGADLRRIVPFSNLFESALETGKEIRRDSMKVGKKLFNVNIFLIELGETVGAAIFDVTNTEFRREQIAARAREVIDKNLASVQEIASRLGEQIADTELLLRSIADDYADSDTLKQREAMEHFGK